MARQQQSDHDLLIKLNTKVDGLISSVRELRDGTQERLSKLEVRTTKLEETHAGIDTRGEVDKIRDSQERIDSLEFRWKIVMFLLAPVYIALIGLIVDLLKKNLIHL